MVGFAVPSVIFAVVVELASMLSGEIEEPDQTQRKTGLDVSTGVFANRTYGQCMSKHCLLVLDDVYETCA